MQERTKEHLMRSGLGFAIFVVGCTSSATEHQLPSATNTPHLDSAPASVACGDDLALYGNTTPDVRYAYGYDGAGRISHITGAYAAGGPDAAIDYTWANDWNMTHMLEVHGWGDSRSEVTATYDGDNLVNYTWDATQADWHDAWTYAFSGFIGANQPTREIISELAGPGFGYELAYDATGRLVQAVPDSGDSTSWTYDDQARTITIDTGHGAFHGVVTYDDQDRELSESWGGSDPSAIASESVYDWTGDRLNTATYRSGTTDAPTQLELVETDTLRYDCAAARANSGRTIRVPKARAIR